MRQFGDVDVTVLLDMSVPLTGLEAVTAQGIQNLIDMPGQGTCSVHLQRLGIDPEPHKLTHGVGAGYLKQVTSPMRWINWWRDVEATPHHVVVLVVHELCDHGYVESPKRSRLLPLALAVGVAPDLLSKFSSIPQELVLHVPPDQLARGWAAVYSAIQRIRCIPDSKDPRLLHKLAFTMEDRLIVDQRLPEAAFARYVGLPRHTLVNQQRQAMLPHVR